MLARYLGNKTSVLGPLMNSIRGYAEPGDHVVDAFSGSLAVSMALKAQGFRVTANDANLFSAVFGDAYLIPQSPPEPVLADLLRSSRIPALRKAAASEVETLLGSPGYRFLDSDDWRRRYVDYVSLLRHLMTMKEADLPTNRVLNSHQPVPLFGGIHAAGVRSEWEPLAGPSTARRLAGWLAQRTRSACVQFWAPWVHSSPRARTWSICSLAPSATVAL